MSLRIESLSASYGGGAVVRDLSLELGPGEALCLLGRNGAGKSTVLKSIMGLVPRRGGSIVLNGVDLSREPPHEVPRRGVGYVPQGRRLFAELSVAENLEIGVMAGGAAAAREDALDLFPILRERLKQRAGTLSGGEQQMLAVARALCVRPVLVLLDEPVEGLMPAAIGAIRSAVSELRGRGVAVLLVEQRVDAVLRLADRVAFLDNGRLMELVAADEVERRPELLRRYLGV